KERRIDMSIYQKIENNQLKTTVDDIEKELIKIPSVTFRFIVNNEKYTNILSFITLRKRFTQRDLHKLTGLSTGYISQALNFLIEVDLVKKVKTPGIRKPYYEVTSIPLSYLKRFRN
ncbi:MAG: hypothetical protein ACFFG0_43255, partial [Candidatus Thorarchaeota archaeon]